MLSFLELQFMTVALKILKVAGLCFLGAKRPILSARLIINYIAGHYKRNGKW